MICCFFYLTFAILGVQLFRGCFGRCVAPSQLPKSLEQTLNMTQEDYDIWVVEHISKVRNRSQCKNASFLWDVDSYNFDSMPEALMSLFVISTLDGWADITRNGMACVGPDIQPIPNYNKWMALYFVSFLLIVVFFVSQ